MNDLGKVSVIIGCYNVSKWLKEKRLSCILNQTYRNLEILLVNDGSTDDTLSICESLKFEDNRIIIVSQKNEGLGSARNTGLNHATGDFIWFYDVDDEAELNLIEKNVKWMVEYKTDLNIFSYWSITPSHNLTQEIYFKEKLIIDNQHLKTIYVDELLLVPNGNGFAWNKFYRHSFIEKHHFRFGNQRIQQDELFNAQIYPMLERVYISSELLYHYFIYNTGNTRSKFIPNRFDIYLSIYKGLKDFASKWGLTDNRLNDYIYHRLYAGLNTSILFNTFHKDAPYSLIEKELTILDILNKPESNDCLRNIDIHKLSLEQKLYYKAYQNKSFYSIYLLRLVFTNLRKIRHFL